MPSTRTRRQFGAAAVGVLELAGRAIVDLLHEDLVPGRVERGLDDTRERGRRVTEIATRMALRTSVWTLPKASV